MIKSSNYSISTDRLTGVVLKEQDSFTCFHCQKVILVGPRQKGEDIGGLCKICMNLICPKCASSGSCTPWEQKMEKFESRERFLRSAGF